MSNRWLTGAVLAVVVGVFGLHSTVSAQNGLPPIHESSASAVTAASNVTATPGRKLPLEQRLVRLERLVDNQALLEMLSRLEDMQAEVQAMRGELEVQRHEFGGIKQRQRDLYLDIDRRILQLEKAASSPPAAAASSASTLTPPAVSRGAGSSPAFTVSSTPAFSTAPQRVPSSGSGSQSLSVATAAAAIDPLQEQSAYQQALNILREGRYDEAIVAFQSFLTRFQESQYAGNAQYWIGEANYVSQRYAVAIEEFQKVLVSYPESSKVADAMLKLGYTFYETKAWNQARQILGELVARFSKTTAAQLAENRLHRMKLEGR